LSNFLEYGFNVIKEIFQFHLGIAVVSIEAFRTKKPGRMMTV
jgi:hypothetical protein